MDVFDYLVVGAGFAGATIAERLAAHAGKRVLICDKRTHIGQADHVKEPFNKVLNEHPREVTIRFKEAGKK